MNKKKTAITIIVSILLTIIVSCSDMNPFFAGGVVPGGNWIYFAEGNDIKRMRLDGNELENVFTMDTSEIRKIQLDPFRLKIYISSHVGANTEKIREYNLDGSDGKLIFDNGAVPISDIALDSVNGFLYFVTSEGIKGIDLKTSQIKDVYTSALTMPVWLAPNFSGSVFYLDNSNNLFRADGNSTSTLIYTLAPAGFTRLSYNRNNNSLYSHIGSSFYKVNPSSGLSTFLKDLVPVTIMSNMVVSTLDSKMYFYDSASFAFYSINFDGSGLSPVKININGVSSLDILSK